MLGAIFNAHPSTCVAALFSSNKGSRTFTKNRRCTPLLGLQSNSIHGSLTAIGLPVNFCGASSSTPTVTLWSAALLVLVMSKHGFPAQRVAVPLGKPSASGM